MSEPRSSDGPPSLEAGGALRRDLDRSVISGLAWTAGARSLTGGFQWLASLLVVRLLTPADYGLVAMATAYLGLVQMFSEFGLASVIIQRRSLSTLQIASLGGVSVISSTAFAVASIGVSGLVADFFDETRVQLVVVALSATFVFTGVDMVSRALLQRDLDFKRLAWVQASQNVSYACFSLPLAALGFGYWSLVLASVSSQFVRMCTALAIRRHPIFWPRKFAAIRSELWFGWHLVVSRFALYVRRFADIVIVGRLLGSEALGAYDVGWTQANLPVDRVTPIVGGVSASVLAASQHDPRTLRRYLRIFTEGLAFMSFPATFGLAVVADDFVRLVFGERWLPAIGPLRILAIVAAMRSITPILSQVLIAKDEAKKNMQFAVIASVVLPLFLLVGSRWGITGVAVGWLIGHPLVTAPWLLRQALAAADMRLGEWLRSLRPAGVSAGAMVLVVLIVRALMPSDWPLATRLAVEVALGAGVYMAGIFFVFRRRFQYFWELVRSSRGGGGPVGKATGDQDLTMSRVSAFDQ